jgi:hypothetical protein
MATSEVVILNEQHSPHQNALDAFAVVLPQIKHAIIASRHDWNKHEPKMWSRAVGVSDVELTAFDLNQDLVAIRSGPTSYGTIIFGKIRIPAIADGFIHVRIHDPPNKGVEDVKFHSLFTDEGNRDEDGHPTTWRAIQNLDTPLGFFNE